VNISIWGKTAEYALRFATKGTMVAVTGELQIEKKNDKIYTRVNVDEIKFFNKKPDTSKEIEQADNNRIDFGDIFPEDDDTNLPF